MCVVLWSITTSSQRACVRERKGPGVGIYLTRMRSISLRLAGAVHVATWSCVRAEASEDRRKNGTKVKEVDPHHVVAAAVGFLLLGSWDPGPTV